MTIAQIDEILTGRFESEADRNYWVEKRAEILRKMKNAEENEKYFRKNRVYDR